MRILKFCSNVEVCIFRGYHKCKREQLIMNRMSTNINKIFYLVLMLGIASVISSCKKDYVDWGKLRRAEISDRDAYISKNYPGIQPKPSGLYYIETKKGTGIAPNVGRTVTVKYKGTLLNGEEFDSGDAFEFAFGSETVIQGWNEGLSYMKKGGKATLIIPSNLAYGAYGQGDIPKYATLVFDIELINVQ